MSPFGKIKSNCSVLFSAASFCTSCAFIVTVVIANIIIDITIFFI